MENENVIVKTKTSKGVKVVLIILIIMVLGLCGYIAYDKYLSKEEPKTNETTVTDKTTNDSTKKDTIEDTKTKDEIPTTDLTQLYYSASEESIEVLYAFLNNGKLYYYYDYKEADGNNEGKAFDFISGLYKESDSTNSIMKEYNSITNIKRIKMFNITTGIDPALFIITEEGKVYFTKIHNPELKDLNFELVEDLKDYLVDDINNYDYFVDDKGYTNYNIKLKDGTTKEIKK